MPLRPITKNRLSQAVTQQLRELIISEGLQAGDKLPSERRLMEELQVSRTPVREALRVLEMMGYVEVRPGSGAYVRAPMGGFFMHLSDLELGQSKTLANHFEIRVLLEPNVAYLAALRAKERDIGALSEVIEELGSKVQSGDVVDSMLADARFHRLLVQATGNETVSMVMDLLGNILNASWRSSKPPKTKIPKLDKELAAQHETEPLKGLNPDSFENDYLSNFLFSGWKAALKITTPSQITIDEHHAILEAVRNGDPFGARQAMLKHLTRAHRDLAQVGIGGDSQEDDSGALLGMYEC